MPTYARASVEIPVTSLTSVCSALLVEEGIQPEAAQRVIDGLIDADRSGNSSHGIAMLPLYVRRLRAGSVTRHTTGRILSENGAWAVIDGRHALGLLVGDQAMTLAVEKATSVGVGVVGVRHAFHFGVAARYASSAAKSNCIGIAISSTRPMISAPGSPVRLVGTNPLAISVPTSGEIPLDLDMSMSVASMGRVRDAHRRGDPIPEGWAKDREGAPTTSPGEAIGGSLQPIGGHKGFGLSLMLDLICGLVSGGAMGDEINPLFEVAHPYDCSQVFVALDLAAFGDVAELKARAEAQAERIRNADVPPGGAPVRTPGHGSFRKRTASSDSVHVSRATLRELSTLSNSYEPSENLGLDIHDL